MTANEQAVLEPKTIDNRLSTPASSGLQHVFLRPQEFFQAPGKLVASGAEAVTVALANGIAGSMGQVDKNMMRAELGAANRLWDPLGNWLLNSWLNYWMFVLAVGSIGAVSMWFLGGWWYKKRLHWCGATDVSSIATRRVYSYQEFIASGPAILVVAVQAILFTNYGEAWRADEYWSGVITVGFGFLSCWTSYVAATSAFSVDRSKARLWFLILPIVFMLVSIGALGTALTMLSGNAE